MKNKYKLILINFGFILVIFCNLSFISGSAQELPMEEQQTLVYDVLEWNDGPWSSTEWTIYEMFPPYGTDYKGNFSSNDGGKIEVTITGYHEKNATYEAFDDLNNIPYGKIAIFDKVGDSYSLNFTLTNVSMNEMGMILIYGFMGWNPGFLTSNDWESHNQYAFSKENLGYTEVNVTLTNSSTTITYDFLQLDGLEQSTILTYNKSNGVLLEAITEFGLYKSHIRIQGNSHESYSIPGPFSIVFGLIALSVIIEIILISKKKKVIIV